MIIQFFNIFLQVNHHFRQNNSYYSQIEHPRWGATQGVITSHDVKAGDELFTYYGYGVFPMPADFPWYWELKMTTEKNERLEAQKARAQNLERKQAKEVHDKDKTTKKKTKHKKKSKK